MIFKFQLTAVLVFLAAISVKAQNVEVVSINVEQNAYRGKSYWVESGALILKPGFIINGSDGIFFAKKHPNLELVNANTDRNYVRVETILKPNVFTEADVHNSSSITDKKVSIEYLDGLGRNLQTVAVKATPLFFDVVQASYYDGHGQASKSYLSYPAFSSSGTFQENAILDQNQFYENPWSRITGDTRPFSETSFEQSPLNRVVQAKAVGLDWANKPITNAQKIYQFEGSFGSPPEPGTVNVPIYNWKIVNGLPQSSTDGKLVVNETVNEQGIATRTYTNFLGRTIMKEQMLDASHCVRTYYVYNEYGNVRFIIPPAASHNLTPDQVFADKWFYQYEYDEQQRLVGTKAPGVGWVYTIYDQWDRPVLTQDANQRGKSPAEWSFVKYDEFNRPIISGIFTTNDSRSVLVSSVGVATGRFEIRNSSSVGYTLNQTYPSSVSEASLLSITYYDNYNYLSNVGWDVEGNSYAFAAESGYSGAVFSSVKDLVTGNKVRVLDTIQWLSSVTYYDNRYRPLQTITEHHFGKTDRLTNEYDFTGQVLKSVLVHSYPSRPDIRITQRFDYDPSGRVLIAWHKVNSNAEIEMASYEYNELGQAVKKKIHTTTSASLQAVDYKYDIQGRLAKVNLEPGEEGDPVDYFGYQVAYQSTVGTGNTARHDGMITAMLWQDDHSQKAYNYGYDGAGQLTTAAYKANKGSGWTATLDRYNETMYYDLNGNIGSLNRKGEVADVTGSIDNLGYFYDGNKLTKVTDTAPSGFKDKGFKDNNTVGDDYAYDANGNLILDKNKNITAITYNQAGLPKQVTFGDNTFIQYLYDATGAKIRQTVYNASAQPISKSDYVGGMIYVNDVLIQVLTPEGHFVPLTGKYYYYLTDHLGSPRVVLQNSGVTNYSIATLETANYSAENSKYLNYSEAIRINAQLFDRTNAGVTYYSTRLNGTTNERYGLAKSLSVMPGDTLKFGVYAKYLDQNSSNWTPALATFMAAIAGGTAPPGTVIDGGATGSLGNGVFPYPGVLVRENDNGTGPKAYLNYLFFDREFNFITGGFRRLSASAKEAGTDIPHELLSFDDIVIQESGYMYIYLSNENDTPVEVYFDDFFVEHVQSPVVQVNGYYPYGLTAYSWIRESEQETKVKFQGKELDEKTGWYNFHARQYDPTTARWGVVDPAGQFASPYSAMGNNPVIMVDPNGEIAFLAVVGIFAAVNVAADAIRGDINSPRDALISFGIGALQGLLAASGPGGLAAYAGSGSGWLTLGSAVAGQINIPVYSSDNFNLSISPSLSAGSTGVRLGVNAFASGTIDNVTLSGGFSLGRNFSAKDLSGTMAEAKWSSIASGNLGVHTPAGTFSYGLTRFGGNYSQTVGDIGYSNGRVSIYHQNDFLSDSGDKYRTAALRASVRINDEVTLNGGFALFTGEGHRGENDTYRINGKTREVYSSETPSFLRNGVLYGGVTYRGNSYRVGWNSEGIRHGIQNNWHNVIGSPHFLRQHYPGKFYSQFGTANPFTNY
jgi:RHS repeat-associated protein